MCDRKSVERSGVAYPISDRWGRPYITYVEVCLGIYAWPLECVGRRCAQVRLVWSLWFDKLANQSENAFRCFNSVDFCASPLRHFDRLSDRWLETVTSTGWCASTSSATCRTIAIEKKLVHRFLLFSLFWSR